VRDAASLVSIRRALLTRLTRHPAWRPIEAQIADRLRAYFSACPPFVRRITTRTPAAILDQIVKYEAVHAIQGPADLRRRLQADRRCYGLFSTALPDQPLVFIEIALTRGICTDVSNLLDIESRVADPESCDCGTFYSISSCDEGLKGIPFGFTLIRAVVDRLQSEMPWLRTYATASPVPGFRAWLESATPARDDGLMADINALSGGGWYEQPELSRRLEARLMPLCEHYLMHEKRGDQPLDPVARFHLGNGARLERLNWLGDRTAAGFRRSVGIVANYVYDPPLAA
jgi:malonyl-CoA decarboxylase